MSLYGVSYAWKTQALFAFFSASDKGSLTVHDKIGMIIIQSSNRFSFYKIFKTSTVVEPYFFDELQPFIKCALTKFRCGVSDTAVHLNSYKKTSVWLM